ncbi:MAG: D-2-hydroxyacid dehydrogenase family protein [Pseudomonadota bacterium]|nr:D-2-hydroxyacid dehydrogenase family protein [Pseudomonadota bacterium]
MTGKLRCAILDDYQDAAMRHADWGGLAERLDFTVFDRWIEPASRAEELAPFEIIVAMRERTVFDADLLSALPRLRLLVTTGMVNASIDMEAAAARDITVSGTRGRVGPAAELAWGLLLALTRKIPQESRLFAESSDRWQHGVGRDLLGLTLGVAGLGRLGSLVAGYGKAFGMDVLGWSRNNTPERSAELGVGYCASLDALLEQSDVVSLHLTLNEETRGIIGRDAFARMKPGAMLINTSRGPLVDEAALVDALREGRIAGAGLDVFDAEPLAADHPLRKLDNVVATPHLGYVTQQTYDLYYRDAVEGIGAWLDGNPVRVLNG